MKSSASGGSNRVERELQSYFDDLLSPVPVPVPVPGPAPAPSPEAPLVPSAGDAPPSAAAPSRAVAASPVAAVSRPSERAAASSTGSASAPQRERTLPRRAVAEPRIEVAVRPPVLMPSVLRPPPVPETSPELAEPSPAVEAPVVVVAPATVVESPVPPPESPATRVSLARQRVERARTVVEPQASPAPASEATAPPSPLPALPPVSGTAPVIEPAPVVAPVTVPEAVIEATVGGGGRTEPPDHWVDGHPVWARGRFECLLFNVGGLKLSVPLVSLGGVHVLDMAQLTPLFGMPKWLMGLHKQGETTIKVVDTAWWIMPEKYPADFAERVRYVIRLHDSEWALACYDIAEAFTLDVDAVRWRTERSRRPWLAGTVIQKMCAILDVDGLLGLLNAAGSGKRSRVT